jgi:hypothetical protein
MLPSPYCCNFLTWRFLAKSMESATGITFFFLNPLPCYHAPNGVVLHITLRLRGTILGPKGCMCYVLTGQSDFQDRGDMEHIIPFLNYLYVTLLHYPRFLMWNNMFFNHILVKLLYLISENKCCFARICQYNFYHINPNSLGLCDFS